MKRYFLLAFFCFFFAFSVFSQIPNQTYFWDTRMPWLGVVHYNPAYTSINANNLLVTYRKNFMNTPGVQSLSFQGAYDQSKRKGYDLGTTLKINQDANFSQVMLRMVVGKQFQFLGCQWGIAVAPFLNSMSIQAGINSQTKVVADLDAGFWIKSKQFHLGGAYQNLLHPMFHMSRLGDFPTYKSWNISAGFQRNLENEWVNKHELFYRKIGTIQTFQWSSLWEYNQKLRLGIAYRVYANPVASYHPQGLNPISLFAGIRLKNQAQLQLSYDLPQWRATLGGNLELSLNIIMKDQTDD